LGNTGLERKLRVKYIKIFYDFYEYVI